MRSTENNNHYSKFPRSFLICLIFITFCFGTVKTFAEPNGKTKLDAFKDIAAPNCELTSLDGKQSEDMHQYHGKVVYVDFWASWCGPCAQSFNYLNDLNNEFSDKGLQVIGINVDENLNDAQIFLVKHPASFHVAADVSGKCPQSFAVKAMPSTYLIDRNGVVRYTHLGFRPSEAKQLRTMVEQLLAEKIAGQ